MSIFNFGKNKASPKTESCCCGAKNVTADDMTNASFTAKNDTTCVKVLGSGCAKCQALEKATVEALAELGMDTTVEHVTDFAQIAAYGVMSTPALVVDGKVVSYGRVLTKDEVKKILQKTGATYDTF
jgi:small redox-active disulfide protein 2